jgi:hypothetical protein
VADVRDDCATAAAAAGVATNAGENDRLAREILRAVRGLRYGSIEITIHDGEVVQIERREKVRLERERKGRAG